ncbi:MAG: hypothetical protein AAGA85_06235 [Bacteroidota bacterium]
MKLRKQLQPNSNTERIKEVEERVSAILTGINAKQDVEVLIRNFNEFTGRTYDLEYFQFFDETEVLEEFARVAANPKAKKIKDISKKELIEIVSRVLDGDPDIIFFQELFEANVPHRRASDLIFLPEELGFETALTPEQIVEEALNPQMENKVPAASI